MKTWTDDEIDILKANYNKMSNDELCKLLPCKTEKAIYKKAYKLGLRKAKEIEIMNRSISHSGQKNIHWNGGVSKTTKGYRLVKMPDHHRADNKGYVLEHILVFENETGIVVPKNCCIHHMNGIKNDNRIENLCMMTHSAHTSFHNYGSKRSDKEKKNRSEGRNKK